MTLQKQRLIWFVVFLVLVLSAFIVPFTGLMRELPKAYGAFLFWNLFALVVIACIAAITARWRD